MSLQVHINGEPKELDQEMSLMDLLASLAVDYRTVAVELSGAVIPRTEFSGATVGDGDRIEIVRFVQGG